MTTETASLAIRPRRLLIVCIACLESRMTILGPDGAPLKSVRPRPNGAAYGAPQPRARYAGAEDSSFLWGWNAQLREPRQDILEAWVGVTSRAIDAMHTSGWISGGLDTVVGQMVGSGLAQNLRPRLGLLGNIDESELWAREVEERFAEWCNDPWSCDLGGRYTMAQLEAQAVRQFLSSGEVVAVLPFVERPGSTHGVKVNLLPSSRLTQRSNSVPKMIQGVELDGYNAPTAYVFDQPWDGWGPIPGSPGMREERVLARDSAGRPAVIHLLDSAPGGVRGMSPMAPVVKVIRQFDQLADATLTAALIQAIFAATLQSDSPPIDVMRALQSEEEQEEGDVASAGLFDTFMAKRFEWYDKTKIDLGRFGKIAHTFPGESLNFLRSEHPNSTYEPFSKSLLREVARCIGTTYEQFTGDYIGATYSSVRMAIADMWILNLYRRGVFPARLKQIVFERWLEEDIQTGATPFPGGVPAYLAQRQSVARSDWRGPPKPTADDLKTAKAQQIQRLEGWVPTEQLAAEYGNDHRDVIESQKRTNDLREANDLPDLPGAATNNLVASGDANADPAVDGGPSEEALAQLRQAMAEGDDARVVALFMEHA